MKYYVSWSGVKDSTASIILCYEKGIHLEGVVMSEVMFDHSRGISGEDPEHIKWVYEVAIPIIENVFGYKVYIVKDHMDYLQEFNAIVSNSKVEQRNGMKRGFFIAGRCVGNRELKMRPLNKFFKNIGEHEQIVGIAYDEKERLKRLHEKYTNRRSILEECKITEEMTYEICKKYNLLSPIYEKVTRGGCWFCPNSKISELADLKVNYPELWNELKLLSQEKNIIADKFRYTKTFQDIENEVNVYIQEKENQIKII